MLALGDRSDHRSQRTKTAARVARPNTLHGFPKRTCIQCRLGQEVDLRPQREDLGPIGGAPVGEYGECLALGVIEPRTGTHAERVVDDYEFQPLGDNAGDGATQVRLCEGQRQKQQHGHAQREKQPVTQPLALRRAQRPPFEKHERAERDRCARVPAQQMQIQR